MKLRYAIKLLFFTSFVFVFSGCHSIGKYPVTLVGLDESGKEFNEVVGGKNAKYIGRSLNNTSEESLKVLDKHKNNSPWELSRIDVGIGITAELEFFVVGIEVTPSFRMTFKKK